MQTTADVHVHEPRMPILKISNSTITTRNDSSYTDVDSLLKFSDSSAPINKTVQYIVRENVHPQSNIKGTCTLLRPLVQLSPSIKTEQTADDVSYVKSQLNLPKDSVKENTDEMPGASGPELGPPEGSSLKKTIDEVLTAESKSVLSPSDASLNGTLEEMSGESGSMSSPPDASLKETSDEMSGEFGPPEDSSLKEAAIKAPEWSGFESSHPQNTLLGNAAIEAPGGSGFELSHPQNTSLSNAAIEALGGSEFESSHPQNTSLSNAAIEASGGLGFEFSSLEEASLKKTVDDKVPGLPSNDLSKRTIPDDVLEVSGPSESDFENTCTRILLEPSKHQPDCRTKKTTNWSLNNVCNSRLLKYIIAIGALLIIAVIIVVVIIHTVGNRNGNDSSASPFLPLDPLFRSELPKIAPSADEAALSSGTCSKPMIFKNGTTLKFSAPSCDTTGNHFWSKNGVDIVAGENQSCSGFSTNDKYEMFPSESCCNLEIRNVLDEDFATYSYRHGFCTSVEFNTLKDPIIGTVNWSCPQSSPSFEMTVFHVPQNVLFEAFVNDKQYLIDIEPIICEQVVHESRITVNQNNNGVNDSLVVLYKNDGKELNIYTGKVRQCPSKKKDVSEFNALKVILPVVTVTLLLILCIVAFVCYRKRQSNAAQLKRRQGDRSTQGNKPSEEMSMRSINLEHNGGAAAADGGGGGGVHDHLMNGHENGVV